MGWKLDFEAMLFVFRVNQCRRKSQSLPSELERLVSGHLSSATVYGTNAVEPNSQSQFGTNYKLIVAWIHHALDCGAIENGMVGLTRELVCLSHLQTAHNIQAL